MATEEKNIKNSGKEEKNKDPFRLFYFIAPLIGLILGVMYVVNRDNLFSNGKDEITLSRKEFEKVSIDIYREIERLETTKPLTEAEILKIIDSKIPQSKVNNIKPK